MKFHILFQLLLFLFVTQLFAQWQTSLETTSKTENLIDCFFVDKNRGWAFSDVYLYKTTDGGINWSQQSSPTSSDRGGCIYFLNENIGFIGTGNDISSLHPTSLYRTDNGGGSWIKVLDESAGYINAIQFIDNNIGFLITKSYGSDRSEIYKTTDGGNSWTFIHRFGTPYGYDIHFFNETNGLSSTVWGIYNTSDGGDNWTKVLSEPIVSMFFINSSTGYGIESALDDNGNCVYYKTTNSGLSWSSRTFFVESVPGYEFKRIFFIDLNTGYILGDDKYDNVVLFKTTNGGIDWSKIDISNLDLSIAKNIQYLDEYTGFLVSEKYIYKYFEGVINCFSPSYDEILNPNETKEINWTSINVNNVQIYYSVDNKTTWNPLSYYTNSDGKFDWYVTNDPSINCYIWIKDYSRPTEVYDYSPKFKIKGLKLNRPLGGEVFWENTIETIEWDQVLIDTILVEFTSNNADWTIIDTVLTNQSSSLSWLVPNIVSNQCKIRISKFHNPDISSTSETFSIIETPYLKIVSPNGGEQWEAGSEKHIVWESINVQKLKILYSTNGGNSWSVIKNNVSASDTLYMWNVENEPNTNSFIKIVDESNKNIFDICDSSFSINPMRTIKLTTPNGGESWDANSEQSILWNSSALNHVKLEYSINNGMNWMLIDSVYSSTGIFKWTVPNILSTQCLVKISDPQDVNLYDMSDSPFAILDPTNIDDERSIPQEFSLFPNYPNPFNPNTTIKFGLPSNSKVTIKVYNALGQKVQTLINKNMSAGHHSVSFDGSALSSGLYFYKISAGKFQQVKKMLLIK